MSWRRPMAASEAKHDDVAPLRVAVVQAAALPGDNAGNAARAAAWVRHARRAHEATLIVFAELFLCGYDVPAEAWRREALVADAEVSAPLATVRDAAVEAGAYVGVGYSERPSAESGDEAAAPTTIFNSFALFAPTGELVLNYRKTHLFGDEAKAFTPGGDGELKKVVTLEPWGLRTGALICFDLEFPEVVRSLALQGARLLLLPTAIVDCRESLVVPMHVLPARASENHMHIAYANLLSSPEGAANPEAPLSFCGRSAVVAANGVVLARASPGDDAEAWAGAARGSCDCDGGDGGDGRPADPEGYPRTEVVWAEVRPSDCAAHRARNPYFELRRPAAYTT
mmetsp:Transcript_14544/g.50663  ORF Transcript_14544/g.50663 Transcript_14544/m.50663 type:complete len:341 (-) Transcript_14544:76-1098(-)